MSGDIKQEQEQEQKLTIRQRLAKIQEKIKVSKGQYNSFGKYNYRSCEDIIEALKPLATKHKLLFTISDSVEFIGERYYIKAIIEVADLLGEEEPLHFTALARESIVKKGMDESQITGTASSYARKYALNGALLIDDTKDADTNEAKMQEKKPVEKASKSQVKRIQDEVKLRNGDMAKILKWGGNLQDLKDMPYDKACKLIAKWDKEPLPKAEAQEQAPAQQEQPEQAQQPEQAPAQQELEQVGSIIDENQG